MIGIALFGFLLTLKQGTVHNSGVDMMVYIVIARLALFERHAQGADGDDHDHDHEYDHEYDDDDFDDESDDVSAEAPASY